MKMNKNTTFLSWKGLDGFVQDFYAKNTNKIMATFKDLFLFPIENKVEKPSERKAHPLRYQFTKEEISLFFDVLSYLDSQCPNVKFPVLTVAKKNGWSETKGISADEYVTRKLNKIKNNSRIDVGDMKRDGLAGASWLIVEINCKEGTLTIGNRLASLIKKFSEEPEVKKFLTQIRSEIKEGDLQ